MGQQNQSNKQEVEYSPSPNKHRNLISKQQEEYWNNSKSTREKSVWPVQMKTKQAEKTVCNFTYPLKKQPRMPNDPTRKRKQES